MKDVLLIAGGALLAYAVMQHRKAASNVQETSDVGGTFSGGVSGTSGGGSKVDPSFIIGGSGDMMRAVPVTRASPDAQLVGYVPAVHLLDF